MDREEDSYTKVCLLAKNSKKAYKEYIGYYKERWLIITGLLCTWLLYIGYFFRYFSMNTISDTEINLFFRNTVLFPIAISALYLLIIFFIYRKVPITYIDFINTFAQEQDLSDEEHLCLLLVVCAKEQGVHVLKKKW